MVKTEFYMTRSDWVSPYRTYFDLCIRSTGQPVYNSLADLVGIYVEVING